MFLNDLSFFSGPSEKLILDNFLTAVVLTELSLLLESPAQLPIKADPPASYSPMWTSSIRGKSEKTALQATGDLWVMSVRRSQWYCGNFLVLCVVFSGNQGSKGRTPASQSLCVDALV